MITILLVLQTSFLYAGKYDKVDKYAAKISYLPLDSLSEKLTQPFHTDLEKVRSIYIWITTHITYDWESYRQGVRFLYTINLHIYSYIR